MPTINFAISRSSVCAGDDADAPHSRSVAVSDTMPIKFVIQSILDSGYLAEISGGHATWIVELGSPVAVVAQQWSKPRFLANPDSPISEFINDSKFKSLHFNYWVQQDPELVFNCLMDGKPLPNRYGDA